MYTNNYKNSISKICPKNKLSKKKNTKKNYKNGMRNLTTFGDWTIIFMTPCSN